MLDSLTIQGSSPFTPQLGLLLDPLHSSGLSGDFQFPSSTHDGLGGDGWGRSLPLFPDSAPSNLEVPTDQSNRDITGLSDDKTIVGEADIAALKRQKINVRGKKETIRGTKGKDIIDASKGKGKNRLLGLGGNDTLIGGKGDRLDGGKGNDTLVAGKKSRQIQFKGGAGNDIFQLFDRRAPKKSHTILDFDADGDRLWFRNANTVSVNPNGRNTVVTVDGKAIATLRKVSTQTLTQEQFTFVGSTPDLIGTQGGVTTMQVLATDDTASEPLLDENDPGIFTVRRSGGNLSQDITVNYTIGGTAESSTDYTELSGTVTIPAGQTEAQILLTPVDDDLIEGDETVTITLQASDAYAIAAENSTTVTIIDAAPEVPIETETFDAPVIEQTSDNTWDMTMTGSDGSQFVGRIVQNGFAVYVQQVTFTPAPASGDQGFNASLNESGNRIEIQMSGESQSTIFETPTTDSLSITYNDILETTPIVLPLPEPVPTPPNTSPTSREAACELLGQFCETVDKIGSTAGTLSAFTALTGIGAFAAGPLGAIAFASKIVKYACIILKGDDQDLADQIFDEAFSFGLGKVFKTSKGAIQKQIKRKLASFGREASDELVDQLSGRGRALDTAEKVYDFTNSLTGFQSQLLSDATNVPDNGYLEAFRRKLGIDFCDEQEPFVNATLTPSTIEYEESATLTVEFFNPDNDSTGIEIIGPSIRTLLGRVSFDIPDELKGGGTLEFSVTNYGYYLDAGPCDSTEDTFLNITVYGAGYDQIESYTLSGTISNASYPCYAIISPMF